MCKWFGRRIFWLPRASFWGLVYGLASNARAGTTGTLGGEVSSADTGAPIVDAKVTAASPSQTSSTSTDRTGRFVFLSLIPDTYALSAAKDGYERSGSRGSASSPIRARTSSSACNPRRKASARFASLRVRT